MTPHSLRSVLQRAKAVWMLLLILCSTTLARAQQVNLQMKNTHLAQVVAKLQQQFPAYRFSFQQEALEKVKVSNLALKAASFTAALDQLQKEYGLHYLMDGNIVSFKHVPVKPSTPQKNPGRVTGKIIDEENGEPVAGATIMINGNGITTDADGNFSIRLPKGKYTASISFVGYGKKEVSDIDVKEEQTFTLNITLKREKGQLSAVVVKASARKETVAALLTRQKNNAATTDGISREQILRTPDNNVAQVLSRVSGINMQENKFAIVRGLSDRYNNVMLNGSVLPGTEPNVRNFSFDLIPSALIDNITVYKTATPELSAEFSGGIIEVNTRDIPAGDFVRIKMGTGINTKTTGKDFYQPKRGKQDFLGFDDNSRQLSSDFDYNGYAKSVSMGYNGGDPDAGKIYGELSSRFPNRYKMYKYTGTPVQDYEVNAAKVKEFNNGHKLGLIAAVTYRNDQQTQQYLDQMIPDGFHRYEGDQYSFNTTLSAMLNAGYSFGKHKISFKNLFSRKFTERSVIYLGEDLYNDQDVKGFGNFPLFNTIFQHRIEGEHGIGKKGFKLRWHVSLANTDRDEPDNKRTLGSKQRTEKTYGYVRDNDNLIYMSSYFSELKEKRYTWSLEAQQPFNLLNKKQLIKFGYQGSHRTADFAAELFTVRPDRNNPVNYYGLPYYEALGADQFGTGKLMYYPYLSNPFIAGRKNGYAGKQNLHAAYVMLDGRFTDWFRITGGLRMEKNKMETNTMGIRYLQDGTPVPNDTLNIIDKTNILPSVNLIFSLSSKFQIRASWYQTLARPEFRELAFFEYYEPDRNTWITGNSLKQTSINNADLRFEYYPSADEIISVSGFYKKFTDPIELQMEAASSSADKTLRMTYMNLAESKDIGIELNFRKSLSFVMPASSIFQHLYISGNFSWMDASVKMRGRPLQDSVGIDGVSYKLYHETEQSRPLFGQAPYLINGALLYAGDKFGINVAYSRTGPRVVVGSEYKHYNEYENARDVIDLQLSYKFLKDNKAEVKINASDLLNQPIIRYFNNFKNFQDAIRGKVAPGADGMVHIPAAKKGTGYNEDEDEIRRKYWMGRNFSISFSYTF